MRFHDYFRTITFRASAAALMCALVAAVASSPRAAQAASSGLAYDELTKIVMGSQGSGPPEPGSYANGSFAADFQAAVNSGGPPKKHGGMFGGITNAMEMGQQAMNMMKNGTPATHYYLNGWERNDDPATQSATIYRGDLKQTIHLDLAKKTYYIVTAGDMSTESTPPPMSPSGPSGPQPSPQPGTAKMTITATTAALGPKKIDDQPANGYKMGFKLAVTEATGSCSNGSFETTMTEFVSRYPEPTLALPSGKVVPKKSNYDPQRMAVKPGCKPTITAHTKIGPTPPSGLLALWTYMQMNAGMGAAQQGQGAPPGAPTNGTFGFLVERGNVRTLGPSDKSLFEIPAGFTQTSVPGT